MKKFFLCVLLCPFVLLHGVFSFDLNDPSLSVVNPDAKQGVTQAIPQNQMKKSEEEKSTLELCKNECELVLNFIQETSEPPSHDLLGEMLYRLERRLEDLQLESELMSMINEMRNKYNGHGVLHLQVLHRRRSMIEKLLNHDAFDPNAQDNDLNTALHYLAGMPEAQRLQSDMKMWELFVEAVRAKRVDPNLQNKDANTALHLLRDPTHVAALIQARACTRIRNNQGRTPLEEILHSFQQDCNTNTIVSQDCSPKSETGSVHFLCRERFIEAFLKTDCPCHSSRTTLIEHENAQAASSSSSSAVDEDADSVREDSSFSCSESEKDEDGGALSSTSSAIGVIGDLF